MCGVWCVPAFCFACLFFETKIHDAAVAVLEFTK